MKSSSSTVFIPHFWWWSWLVVIVIALMIRLPMFGQVPAGLNRDEAALGYNAYSILKSGHDEYGKYFPVSITSFGDQKLPGYVYTLIPFVQLFDLSPVTVRLPSLLSGLVVITMIGLLTLLQTKTIFSEKQAVLVSSVAMLFIAISPWGNHFSRTAYEAHLAMACFVSGFFFYNLAFTKEFLHKQRLLLILAGILWSATLLTYHSYHIFTPLFIFGVLILDWKRIVKADRVGIIASVGIGLATVVLLFAGGVWSANLRKSGDISPFHKQSLQAQASSFRHYLSGDTILDKVYANPLTEGTVRFSQNLVQVMAGSFMFVSGTDHGDHNPGNIPNFHLLIAPFLIIGLLTLWDHRRKKTAQLFLLWLVVALVPSSLTITPQHTVRFSPAFPVIELIAAIGLLRLFGKLSGKTTQRIFIGAMTYLLILSASRQMLQYLFVIPPLASPNATYPALAKAIAQYESQGFQVVTQSPTSSPYIWYLFETKYNPDKYLTDVVRYPVDEGGFQHVHQVGNVWFESIQWGELDERAKAGPLILIFKPTEIPGDHRESPNMKFIDVIKDDYDTVKYEIWKLSN